MEGAIGAKSVYIKEPAHRGRVTRPEAHDERSVGSVWSLPLPTCRLAMTMFDVIIRQSSDSQWEASEMGFDLP